MLINILRAIPPSLVPFKSSSMQVVDESLAVMEGECRALLAEKKAEAAAGGPLMGKDLISVLVRANVAAAGKECLSDEEVISQVSEIQAQKLKKSAEKQVNKFVILELR